MSKLLHIKGSRVKVLSSLPTNSFGDDGDIVLSSIKGKGAYLCAKMNGRWHVANKLEDLKKMERTSIRDLKVDKLRIGNATLTKDEYDKPVGNFTLDVAGDIELNADGGQVTIKDDSASHFLFDCDATTLTIYDDTDVADLFKIVVGASGVTTISTVDDGATVGHLTLQPDGDLVLDPASRKIIINAADALYFDGGSHTYINEITDDKLKIVVGADRMLTLDEASDAITLAATNWIAGTVSGDTVTEFSVANSAYAGMILGYTTVGIDATADSYTLTTSMVVTDSAHKVKFVAPPSGVVEISAQIYWDTARRIPVLGLSDNATYAAISFPNATDVTNEHVQAVPPSALGDSMLRPHWVVTGLTPGTAYEWWLGAKTSAGTGGVLRWGGTATNEYPPFIMKAIALPAAVTDYAVYG